MTMNQQQKEKLREIIAYLFFGVLTTIVSISTFYIFNDQLHWNYLIATILSTGLGILFAFFTNKWWVFKSKFQGWLGFFKEMTVFFWYRLLSMGIELIVMYIMVSLLHWNALVAKTIAQVIVVVLNYVFSKLLIFKKK